MAWFNTKPKHQWTKWVSYQQGMILKKTGQKFYENWQRRSCIACGKTQEEEIRGSYGQ